MKKYLVLLLSAVMAVGGMATAYGDTGEQTATLQTAKMRFDGGEVKNIQCYNIDGYSFVRARDITNALNMTVSPILNGNNGIYIDPYTQPVSKKTAERLTKQSASVKVEKGELIYDGWVSDAECFLLDGRYYFKLIDFMKAADTQNEVAVETVKFNAKNGKAPYMDSCNGIHVVWQEDIKVIDVTKTKIDLLAVSRGADGAAATTKDASEQQMKPAGEATQKVSREDFAEEFTRLVNLEREKAGLEPLQLNEELCKAAEVRAGETAKTFAHTRPNGEPWYTVLKGTSFEDAYAGENAAGKAQTPSHAVEVLVNSPEHKENMLRERFNEMGIAFSVEDGDIVTWVQIMAEK